MRLQLIKMTATIHHFPMRRFDKAMHKFISEEELDAHKITLGDHNVTADTFSHKPVTPNTQGQNENSILASERLNNSDALAEILKGLTIKDARYYESGSSNENDAKGNPASDSKVDTQTSDGNKRKVTDTSNKYL